MFSSRLPANVRANRLSEALRARREPFIDLTLSNPPRAGFDYPEDLLAPLGDAQIFVDLVDNPRLDHEYTVFAQVLNGIEVVDQILEGDIIERIEILVGS